MSEQDPNPKRIDQRQQLAAFLTDQLEPNQVFILLLVSNEEDKTGTTHYISNGERQSVYIHLRNLLKKWERDFQGSN